MSAQEVEPRRMFPYIIAACMHALALVLRGRGRVWEGVEEASALLLEPIVSSDEGLACAQALQLRIFGWNP